MIFAATAFAFDVVDEPRWAERLTLPAGAGEWRVEQGLVFPVVDDDGAPAGFAVVGPGAASFAFAAPGESWWFAALLDPAAVDGDWSAPFDLAVSFGARAGDAALWRLPPADVRNGGVSYREPDGRETVVVTAFRYGNAFARAREAVRTRAAALARAGVDPEVAHTLEGVEPVGRWLGEVHTERVLTPLLEPAFRTLDDRWLSFSVDPTGLVDPDRAALVFVHGVTDGDAPRWATITGRGAPDRGWLPVRGVANLVASPTGADRAAAVDAEAVLAVGARGGSSRIVPLAFPPLPPIALESWSLQYTPPLRVEEVTTRDGAPLVQVAPWYGPWAPERGGLYALPEAADEARVRVGWRDTWLVVHSLDLIGWAGRQYEKRHNPKQSDPAPVRLPAYADLGQRTVGRAVWPTLGRWSPRYDATLRFGSLRSRWLAAVAGDVALTEGDGTRLWQTRGSSDDRVSLGDVKLDVYAAAKGLPEVRVDKGAESEGTPPFLRAVLNYFGTVMPPFPYESLLVLRDVQHPICPLLTPADDAFSIRNLAPEVSSAPGLLVVHGRLWVPFSGMRMQDGTAFAPPGTTPWLPKHPVERGFAEGLARQWLDRLDYGPRDAWIPDAASAYYRDRFVEQAYGARVARQWRDLVDERLSRDPSLPTGLRPLGLRPEPWAGEIGARLLRELIEPRIGESAFLAGMRRFLDGGVGTTDALVAALSEASGVPLGPLFEAFVVAGLRPALGGAWVPAADGVRIELTADPPIGAYEVPVLVETTRARRTVWVPVRDGRGALEAPIAGSVRRVEVDPNDALGQRGALPSR